MEIFIFLMAIMWPAVKAADSNTVYNPCSALPTLRMKDSVTIALGFTGNPSVWYNQSDPSLSLLSPCDQLLINQLPKRLDGTIKAKVAVFRPLLDQISVLRINNASYLDLITDFPGNASVIAFAGNPTVVSQPRYFLVPYGRVPTYTLVIELHKGQLTSLLWKDDECRSCGQNSDACFENTCASPETACLGSSSTLALVNGLDPCRFAINVAFSGTDKNNVLLNSWYQVKSINQYSLTSLFGRASTALSNVGASIIDDGLGG